MAEILGDDQVFLAWGETWVAPLSLEIVHVNWLGEHDGRRGVILTIKPSDKTFRRVAVDIDWGLYSQPPTAGVVIGEDFDGTLQLCQEFRMCPLDIPAEP